MARYHMKLPFVIFPLSFFKKKKKITEHVTCCKSKLIGFEFETQVLIEFCLKPFETVLLFLFKVVLYIKV